MKQQPYQVKEYYENLGTCPKCGHDKINCVWADHDSYEVQYMCNYCDFEWWAFPRRSKEDGSLKI